MHWSFAELQSRAFTDFDTVIVGYSDIDDLTGCMNLIHWVCKILSTWLNLMWHRLMQMTWVGLIGTYMNWLRFHILLAPCPTLFISSHICFSFFLYRVHYLLEISIRVLGLLVVWTLLLCPFAGLRARSWDTSGTRMRVADARDAEVTKSIGFLA